MSILVAQAWPFIHPAVAAAALGCSAIPILVHLIHRRRYTRTPWAAMVFLLAASRRSARRIGLEQALLLLVRIGAIVLLGLSVARPFAPAVGVLPVGTLRRHHIVLLDNSRSMNAQLSGGRSRFAAARQVADELVGSFGSSDAVSIITLGGPATGIIAEPSYDRRFIRERLAAIEQTQSVTDTLGAVGIANEIIKRSKLPKGNRMVYMISDFAGPTWRRESDQETTPSVQGLRRLADSLVHPESTFRMIRIADDNDNNAAITDLRASNSMVGLNSPVRMTATVVNFGSSPMRNRTLQLRRDGRIVRREPLPIIEPGASIETPLDLIFTVPGAHKLEARLTPTADALEDDDVRYLALNVRHQAAALLVDGKPGDTQLAGQAGFLAMAWAPEKRLQKETFIDPHIITEGELTTVPLDHYDVVALCNVPSLTRTRWALLTQFVQRGGGLLIFGGDSVEPGNYNRGDDGKGNELLPGRLLTAPQETMTQERAVGFSATDLSHALVRDFAGQEESGLFAARVDRYLGIELDAGRSEVALRFTNGDPALVTSSLGKGRIIWLATSANMDWTNLPAKGDYVSLMLSCFAYVASQRGEQRNLLVGQRIVHPLTAAQSSLPIRVSTDDGEWIEPSLVPLDESLALEYGPLDRAGSVTVSIGPVTEMFAVNVDPIESDIAPASEQAFRQALDRAVSWSTGLDHSGENQRFGQSTELGSLVLYLALGLLLAETGMAMWFGSNRHSQAPPRSG